MHLTKGGWLLKFDLSSAKKLGTNFIAASIFIAKHKLCTILLNFAIFRVDRNFTQFSVFWDKKNSDLVLFLLQHANVSSTRSLLMTSLQSRNRGNPFAPTGYPQPPKTAMYTRTVLQKSYGR